MVSRRSSVTSTDLRRLLDVVDASSQPWLGERRFPAEVLAAIATLVSADQATYEEVDPYHRVIELTSVDATGTHEPTDEPTDHALVDLWWRAFWESCAFPQITGNFSEIWGSGDALPGPREGRQWHDFATAVGLEDASDMVMSLEPQGPIDRRLLVWRADGVAFTEFDAKLLGLVRPHLQQMLHRQRDDNVAALTLTPRQSEILRLASTGCSNAEIARLLVLSEGTVRKHLENIYRRLDVTSRGAAVAWLRSQSPT